MLAVVRATFALRVLIGWLLTFLTGKQVSFTPSERSPALELQIALAKAQTQGGVFVATRKKTIRDAETGIKRHVETAMTVRPWWWTAQNGNVVLSLRYGARPIEISKGKNAIEVGSMDNLVDTLLAVREAVLAGELDTQIDVACGKVRAGFKQK